MIHLRRTQPGVRLTKSLILSHEALKTQKNEVYKQSKGFSNLVFTWFVLCSYLEKKAWADRASIAMGLSKTLESLES